MKVAAFQHHLHHFITRRKCTAAFKNTMLRYKLGSCNLRTLRGNSAKGRKLSDMWVNLPGSLDPLSSACDGHSAHGSGFGLSLSHQIGCITFIKHFSKRSLAARLPICWGQENIHKRDVRGGGMRGNSCDDVLALMWCRSRFWTADWFKRYSF